MHNPATQYAGIEASHVEGDGTDGTEYLQRSDAGRAVSDPSPGDIEYMREARVDPAAFKTLYERYFDRVYNYCLHRVGHREDAEDITSAVFTQALKAVCSYRGGSVAAWIFRIAHNAIVSYRRSRNSPTSSLTLTSPNTHHVEMDKVPSREATPLESVIQAEDARTIMKLVDALPEAQKELLLLWMTGRLTSNEIGAVLGKTEGAVRVALHRTIRQLRKSYSQTETEDYERPTDEQE